jgi:hypothetical protein
MHHSESSTKPGGTENEWYIHQLLAYADVNLLGDNTNTIKKSTETITDASIVDGLIVNTDKINYMFTFHHQNAGKNNTKKTS